MQIAWFVTFFEAMAEKKISDLGGLGGLFCELPFVSQINLNLVNFH